jgi:(E)-4-hydroxy-3-methylbut-2-enyl-diphosphate synthase
MYHPQMLKNALTRFPTRTVSVGKIKIGSDHPIRIQSMITSNTNDIAASLEQIIKLNDAGCDIVRLTVQGMKEAQSLEKIKNELCRKNIDIPLVADIHFFPKAAYLATDFVEKIRINPGNFHDPRAQFKQLHHTEESYHAELERIKEKFVPLITMCKKKHRALRIGTNHGSLSDRIMSRYGDSPIGMVMSALEYANVCREENFHQFVFSMKSSNPIVMIEAYRLLVKEMIERDWDYPLHLGVTEAGDGMEGRIKSATGIGSLLLDGIGDTIRVSLTEDPWEEITPCKEIIAALPQTQNKSFSLFFPDKKEISHEKGIACFFIHSQELEQLTPSSFDIKKDYLIVPESLKQIPKVVSLAQKGGAVFYEKTITENESLICSCHTNLMQSNLTGVKINSCKGIPFVQKHKPDFVIFSPKTDMISETRELSDKLSGVYPIYLKAVFENRADKALYPASILFGSLLCDDLIQGLSIHTESGFYEEYQLSLQILQATRQRLSKTDFISCPSCGRTLFDLQQVTSNIKKQTSHLPGVKIAIMGCIVNGPGEMADADFGYVGSRPGKIDLYIQKKCVKKGVDEKDAVAELIKLIKQEGKWIDPVTELKDESHENFNSTAQRF